DPNAGTTVIKSAIILIVVEVAIALNEAEALRIGIDEGIGLHLRWIVERPPYALALARPKRQAVAVVDFGPPILATARIVLAVPEHAGERRDPQSLDRISREKIHVHGHNGALGTFGIDPIGAGNAGAIQQRVNGHGVRTLRLAKPEFGKARKFLRPRHRSVDGNAARRRAILVLIAGRAEITCALERKPIGVFAGAVHHPEAGETEVRRQLFVETGPAVIEIRRRIENLARRGAIHDVDADRLLDITIEMEKADREIAGSLRPKAIFRLELDFLIEVETDRLDELGRRRRLGPVRLCRRRSRASAQS